MLAQKSIPHPWNDLAQETSKEEQVGSQGLLSQEKIGPMSAGLKAYLHRPGPETPTPQRLTGERRHHGESCPIHQRPDGPLRGLAEGEPGLDEPDTFDGEISLGGKSEGGRPSLDYHGSPYPGARMRGDPSMMVGVAGPPPPDAGPV